MTVLILIVVCIVLAVVFFGLGSALGNYIGKKKKFQDEVLRNGSKRR